MANYYLDHGAYPAYAAVPTWNTAQDGDGKATGLATPAVASILLTGQPSTGNTLSICGVSFGATSGGTHNYTIGASISATADNIATLINSSSATTNVSSSVATGTPQIRNLLYARGPSTGAPANTVEIMTRVGSADFNNATNAVNWTITQSGWTNIPTFTQWAGGASGVWGYLVNEAAIWPSAIAAGSYGVYKSGANAQPFHGPATLDWYDDVVYSRCRGQTLTQASNTGVAINRTNLAIVYDDGSGLVPAWSGDTGVFKYLMPVVGANATNRKISGAVRVSEKVMTYGRFVIEIDTGLTSGQLNGLLKSEADGGEYLAENIKVNFTNISNNANQYVTGAGNGGKVTLRGCKIYWPNNSVPNFVDNNQSSGNEIIIENCDVVYTGSPPAPVNAFFNTGSTNTPDLSQWICRNFRVIGLPSAQKLFSIFPTAFTRMILIGDSCEGFDVPATLVGFVGANSLRPAAQTYMMLYNMGPKRGFTHECTQGYLQWWDGQDFPTYSARLPDNSNWSLRYRWISSKTYGPGSGRPFVLWRQSFTVLTSGKQTVTAELLVDPTYASAISKGHIALDVGYVSAVTDGRKVASSLEAATNNALASSSAAWTLGSTYNGYTKVNIVLTLPDAIKQNTEIECSVKVVRPAPTADQYLFLDPEVALS